MERKKYQYVLSKQVGCVHSKFENSSTPSSLMKERRISVLGEDLKSAAKMIKDKDRLLYK